MQNIAYEFFRDTSLFSAVNQPDETRPCICKLCISKRDRVSASKPQAVLVKINDLENLKCSGNSAYITRISKVPEASPR